MAKARRAAKMPGGGVRQAGLIAAPALVALKDPYPGHKRDNELARRLGDGLAALDARLVEAASVQTNIVSCFHDDAKTRTEECRPRPARSTPRPIRALAWMAKQYNLR
jgi:threonine aldolase